MDLQDTISDMISNNYKRRFIAEYNQLKIRNDKLLLMLEKYYSDKLEFKPINIDILVKQQLIMSEYLKILEQRAILEDINIASR